MKKNHPPTPHLPIKSSTYWALVALAFVLPTLLYHLPALQGMELSSDDYHYAEHKHKFFSWPYLLGSWGENYFLGFGTGYSLTPINLINFLLPPQLSINFLYGILSLLTLFASYLLFRSLRFEKIPATSSAFLFTLAPAYLTFSQTGHNGKIILITGFCLGFAFINLLLSQQTRSWRALFLSAVAAAVGLALGFLGTALQTGLYLTVVLFCYTLLLLFYRFRSEKKTVPPATPLPSSAGAPPPPRQLLKTVLALLCVPLLVYFLSTYQLSSYVDSTLGKLFDSITAPAPAAVEQPENNTEAATEENATPPAAWSAEQEWNWATQWSLPKIETLDFIMPGLFGYLSNDPENPYWGATGRTPGYEQHRQGYANYSLLSNYLGIFLAFFVCYSWVFLLRKPGLAPRSAFENYLPVRKLVLFWTAVAVFSLLAAYGRFFPLYSLLYKLPLMDSFRNPNKFLQVFHFAVGIIGAYGLNDCYFFLKTAWQNRTKKSATLSEAVAARVVFFKVLLIGSIALGVAGLLLTFLIQESLLKQLTQLFGSQANLMLENLSFYQMKFIFVSALAGAMLLLLTKSCANRKTSPSKLRLQLTLLFCFALLDVSLVNRHFFPFKPPSDFSQDPVVAYLKEEQKKAPVRVRLLDRKQYLNYFLWNVTRFDISLGVFEHRALRRGLPERDRNYFTQLNNPDLRQFKLAAVTHLLSQSPVYHPELRLEKEFSFAAVGEKVYVYALLTPRPRAYAAAHYLTARGPLETLALLNSPTFELATSVVVSEETVKEKPQVFAGASAALLSSGKAQKAELVSFNKDRYRLKTEFTTNAFVVLANEYSGYWEGWGFAEGSENPIALENFKVNYYFNGYLVPPSVKQVVLQTRGQEISLQKVFQEFKGQFHIFINYFIALGLIGYFFYRRAKRQPFLDHFL